MVVTVDIQKAFGFFNYGFDKTFIKWIKTLLKSDSHVPENFCQIKIFPSHVRKNTITYLFGV